MELVLLGVVVAYVSSPEGDEVIVGKDEVGGRREVMIKPNFTAMKHN